MMTLQRRLLALATITTFAGCATNPTPSPAPAADALSDCAGRSAESADWRPVLAEGFAFCMPPDWRPGGRNVWNGDGGHVTWETQSEKRPFVVASVPGTGPADLWERTERIGGASAKLRTRRVGSTYYTSAVWTSPRFSMTGEASSFSAAQRQLEIYRTVRFILADR